jgi:hypothetical protein
MISVVGNIDKAYPSVGSLPAFWKVDGEQLKQKSPMFKQNFETRIFTLVRHLTGAPHSENGQSKNNKRQGDR